MTSAIRAFLILGLTMAIVAACTAKTVSTPVPAPPTDEARDQTPTQRTAVLAGGCFWGVQAVFQHVKGVISATSGYAGGEAKTAHYEMVSDGNTGHAESVQIVYDRSQITYGELLRIYFSVAHDPTQLNRQGPDEGTQYRSSIFYSDASQKQIAEAYVAKLNQDKVFRKPVVTQVVQLKGFYPAEGYHQNYAEKHPDNPYIAYNDAPKVENLRKSFPEIYTGK
jgi:peptide-methionine (S)-S-oxide reductase